MDRTEWFKLVVWLLTAFCGVAFVSLVVLALLMR